MPNKKTTVISGVIIESSKPLSFDEMCQAVHVDAPVLTQMIELNLIVPQGESPHSWLFDSICLKRAKVAVNLHQDLEINMSGIGLALDLLDKIERLETRINMLEMLFK